MGILGSLALCVAGHPDEPERYKASLARAVYAYSVFGFNIP